MVTGYKEIGKASIRETIQVVSGTAATPSRNGMTTITGGITIAANATASLADGEALGELKTFYLVGALTTSDFVVTLATAGLQADGATALVSFDMDAATDFIILEWMGELWQVKSYSGVTLNAS